MRIERLSVFTFPAPFRMVFRHASASRGRAENLIVAVRADSGRTGYGEGCPRHYVSGETVRSGLAFIRQCADTVIREVGDTESLRAWISAHRDAIDRNPAACCALETAILDLIGKVERRPIEDLVGVPRSRNAFKYSAVLGDAPHPAYWWRLRRYRKRGFRDFKVKISGNLRRDRRKMLALAGAGQALRVRLDANNLWVSPESCVRHLATLPGNVFAVEEPLQAGDLEGFRQVGEECGTKIVLDESLLRIEQIEALAEPDRWIVNLRVSKMGGVLRSLAIAERAVQIGAGVIVGCQVGETSILTRAAWPIMQAVGEKLIAAEGAFGTHLLRRDLTSPSLRFGPAGVLAVDHASETGLGGLGLAISTRDLEPLGAA